MTIEELARYVHSLQEASVKQGEVITLLTDKLLKLEEMVDNMVGARQSVSEPS